MKAFRYCIIALVVVLLFIKPGFSQSNPRLQNENYMQTVFLENFSGSILDRSIWYVEPAFKRGLGLLVDNPLTLRLNNDQLELSMLYSPGSTAGKYTGDYIGAEIISRTKYRLEALNVVLNMLN